MREELSSCRSHCPISYALDFVGDRWTLIVLRDLILGRKRYFREFLGSQEGIATNILTARLKQLEAAGLVTRTADPKHPRRGVYTPTDKALDLLPTLVELVRWGAKYDPKSDAPVRIVRGIAKDRDGFVAGIRAQHKKAAKSGA
jgi:DNA-binding HxlR family transcriptional regulator